MNSMVIDSFEFCRLAESRIGEVAISDLSRLVETLKNNAGSLRWSLNGGFHSSGHPQLTLSVIGRVHVQCQRCLEYFDFNIASECIILLAKDEASADEIDDLLASEEVEVIVGSPTLNVFALVEDEALLALPLAPSHETCPKSPLRESMKSQTPDSPFSVLKKLKQ